jgi:Family of unknown function (DUF6585)
MAVECAKCKSHIVETENRLPPWCPACGGSLKDAVPVAGPPRSVVMFTPGESQPTALAKPAEPLAEVVTPPVDISALGEPEQVFRGSISSQLFAWFACLLGTAFLALIIYVSIHPPKKPASPAAMLMLGAMGATCAFGGLYFAIKFRRTAYLVFRDALVQCDGGDFTIIPWEHIRQLYETIHPAWITYRVVTRKGLTGDIRNHRALGTAIGEKMIERLLPASLKELDQGRAVSFGPLGVSRGALLCQGEQMAWYQVRLGFGLKPDHAHRSTMLSNIIHLHVYHANGPTTYLQVDAIPNFRLFLALVRQLWPQCVPEGI